MPFDFVTVSVIVPKRYGNEPLDWVTLPEAVLEEELLDLLFELEELLVDDPDPELEFVEPLDAEPLDVEPLPFDEPAAAWLEADELEVPLGLVLLFEPEFFTEVPVAVAAVAEAVTAGVATGVAEAEAAVMAWPELAPEGLEPDPIAVPAEMAPPLNPPTCAEAPATYETPSTPRLANVEKTFVEVLTRQTPLREFVRVGFPRALGSSPQRESNLRDRKCRRLIRQPMERLA